MRCSRTNAATSKVYTLFSYCILRNGRVRAFCSFRWLFGGGSLLKIERMSYVSTYEWVQFRLFSNEAFENKHIIKRCFSLQIYKAETRRSIERRYVRRLIEQPPTLQKNGVLLNYYQLRFRFPQPQLLLFYVRHLFFRYPLSTDMDGGRIDQKRCFTKTLFLWNSQGNLQYGRYKLPKHRYCVESLPSVVVEEWRVFNSPHE